ncbi:MAG: hypothetical protein KIS88_00110 [Anaerolineales bacterium]|nr:hypothetical protein [Anaerolineales bacterium]
MSPRPSLTLETTAYIAIALLALILRFGNLGLLPLNAGEAAAALPAYTIAQGDAATIGAQPAYTLLTSLLFSIVPSSDFFARWWPALAGWLLVLVPYAWRDVLGRKTALVLALGLALDPGLVAISRLASGHMLALASVAGALTAWRAQRASLAGALAGLALLSAPTIYVGVLAALFVWAFFVRTPLPTGANWRPAALSAVAVLLLGSTLFLRVPSGLGSLAAPLAAFLQGWVQPSQVSLLKVLFALLGYGLPALVFGVWGAVLAWRESNTAGQLLSLFALIALAIVLLYPGRQVADVLWVVIPLWGLAAQTIGRYLFVPQEEPRAAWGEALLMLVLMTFLVLSLARIASNEFMLETPRFYLYVVGGVLLLAAVASVLIGLGWSRQAAVHGLVWALSIGLALYALAGATRPASLASARAAELWAPGPAAGQLDLLRASLKDLSEYNAGVPSSLSVDVRMHSAELAWLLRELPSVPADRAVSLIITAADEAEPAEASAYHGQSFVLHSAPAWESTPPNLLGWLLYRQAPETRQYIILWAASNLLPQDVAANSSGESR